jgi:hypothetical protein
MSYQILKKTNLPTDIINIILNYTGPKYQWMYGNFKYLLYEFYTMQLYSYNYIELLQLAKKGIESAVEYRYYDVIKELEFNFCE